MVPTTVDSVILEDDCIVSASIQAEELAVAVLFGGYAVEADFLLQFLDDLLRVLMNRAKTKYVENQEKPMVRCHLHLRAHEERFVSCLY